MTENASLPVWPHVTVVAGFAGLWILFTDAAVSSWIVGIPAVLAAALAARRLRRTGRVRVSITGMLRFVPWFMLESLRSGVNVARRTLAPRMRIRPGFTVYEHELPSHSAALFFVNCVSLLPGTLAADVDERRVTVHMLDSRDDPTEELRELEHTVSRIYIKN